MTDTKDTKKEVEEVKKTDSTEKTTAETTTDKKDAPAPAGESVKSTPADSASKGPGANSRDRRGGPQRGRRGPGKPGGGRGRRGGRFERQKPEFDQKIISIRRVTRVVAGGRRFAFSVSLVAGNKNGKVGVGIGKATDTALAIEKAAKDAKKNMVVISRTKDNSIAHDVRHRFCSSDIYMQPAPGKGIVAGSSVRVVLDLAGVTDVSGKIFSRSKNQLNNAKATIKALQDLPKTAVAVEEKKEDPKKKPTAKKAS